MLLAITHGKAGRIGADIPAGSSWRDVFKTSEDLLTAAVFGRLAYLSGATLWSILRSAFGGELPNYKVAELTNASFWPTWQEDDNGLKTVEPDGFLQFEVGDPSVRIDIILEAKYRAGYDQYAEQWRRQWNAYHKYVADGDGATAYLLAVGGLGAHAATTMHRLQEELRRDGLELKVIAANWPKLLDAIVGVMDGPLAGAEKRILGDIVEAMALAGFRHVQVLGEMRASRRISSSAKVHLMDYDFRRHL